jgi:hypothetical protein
MGGRKGNSPERPCARARTKGSHQMMLGPPKGDRVEPRRRSAARGQRARATSGQSPSCTSRRRTSRHGITRAEGRSRRAGAGRGAPAGPHRRAPSAARRAPPPPRPQARSGSAPRPRRERNNTRRHRCTSAVPLGPRRAWSARRGEPRPWRRTAHRGRGAAPRRRGAPCGRPTIRDQCGAPASTRSRAPQRRPPPPVPQTPSHTCARAPARSHATGAGATPERRHDDGWGRESHANTDGVRRKLQGDRPSRRAVPEWRSAFYPTGTRTTERGMRLMHALVAYSTYSLPVGILPPPVGAASRPHPAASASPRSRWSTPHTPRPRHPAPPRPTPPRPAAPHRAACPLRSSASR